MKNISNHIAWVLLALLLCLRPALAADLSNVADIRIGEQNAGTRIVVELSKAQTYKIFYLPNPARVVIDLPELTWSLSNGTGTKQVGLVKGFRYGLFSPGTSRIVVDLAAPAEIYRMFTLPSSSSGVKNDRLVFDIKTVSPDRFAELTKSSATAYQEEASKEAAATPPPKQNIFQSNAKPVIVIDAGHGGVDPGSIGVNKTKEKNVTLAIAKAMKRELERSGKYKVILTRDRDIFLKLGKRVDVARQHYADLFISVHADSHPDHSTRGLSVYTLSETASDKEAERLAARENKADLIAGVDLEAEPSEVSNILIDLTQRETMNLSARFAQGLVKELAKRVSLLKNTHRFAGFAVLKGPDIPAVLVETGYLSNASDERLLNSADYQKKIAQSVTKAVDDFFAWKTTISSL